MLLNFFSRKQRPVKFADKVFSSHAAKEAACIALAKKDLNVIFIAWFPGTAAAFKTLFSNNELNDGRILLVRALHYAKIAHSRPVFLEHFPLAEAEQELVKGWNLEEVDVYSSLNEPILQRFGGEQIKNLLLKLGLKEDEAIEHSMISKALLNAQLQLAKKATFPLPAGSQAEWFEKNIDN